MVKEFWQSINICRSYGQKYSVVVFFLTHVVYMYLLAVNADDCECRKKWYLRPMTWCPTNFHHYMTIKCWKFAWELPGLPPDRCAPSARVDPTFRKSVAPLIGLAGSPNGANLFECRSQDHCGWQVNCSTYSGQIVGIAGDGVPLPFLAGERRSPSLHDDSYWDTENTSNRKKCALG